MDQWNRIHKLEVNLHIYRHVIFKFNSFFGNFMHEYDVF